MKINNQATQLPQQEVLQDILNDKYCKNGETTVGEIQTRVALALAQVESESEQKKFVTEFLKAQQNGFIAAGRVNSAAGTDIQATLMNCFVQPIEDAICTGDKLKPGIYDALTYAAETMRRGGGVGYDFSAIRPKNAKVKSTASRASGPVSYMNVFDKSCQTVESAGARRGAQMGVMRCDHPDILEFIEAKRTVGALTNFNVSVGITDSFMEALKSNGTWELVHKAEPVSEIEGAYKRDDGLWVYGKVLANDLWEKVMQSTYNHAEPGVLFLDNINRDNNLSYCETIAATNPYVNCGLP